MLKVLIPTDSDFCIYENECKNLYQAVQHKITDTNSFEFIKNNTYFYMFINDNTLIGAIYYFKDLDGKLFLNGFANRKMHALCLECLKMSLNWFKGSIYAEAQNRASALCLLKCGFKRLENNVFIFNQELTNK